MLSFVNDSVQLRKEQSYYEIKLREQATQLKEVKVTAKAITARGILFVISSLTLVRYRTKSC